MRLLTALLICGLTWVAAPSAQTRRTAPSATRTETPEMNCPSELGGGVKTKRTFCDVLIGRDPAAGIIITLPPHRGDVTLKFDLHDRHTYSEDAMKDRRAAYARYTAVIGALTADNTLISRAVAQFEFRTADDLFDRVSGGAGPSGVKAVAPVGAEPITITIPAAENTVSILGEKLMVDRADGSTTYTSEGRPIAIISNVTIEYRPAPAPRRSSAPSGSSTGRRPR